MYMAFPVISSNVYDVNKKKSVSNNPEGTLI